MGGVIACHAHGRDGEVGEMDGAGLGAWRRVRSPSWGTSLVLGLPVFWSPAVGAWCARRLRWPGSYSGDWSRKWGRIRLGGTHLRDVSRLWGTATVGGGAAGLPSADFFGRGCGRLGCLETCPLAFLGHVAGAWVACLLVTVRGRLCGGGVRRRRAFPTWAVGRESGAAFGLTVPARAMFRAFGDVICSPLLSLSPRPAVDGNSANWLGVEAAAWRGEGDRVEGDHSCRGSRVAPAKSSVVPLHLFEQVY